MNQKGNIYIVSTPIGNIEDITFRAIKILKNVSIIFCEDTRTSKKLLTKYEINTNLESLHMFNELSKENRLRDFLNQNKDVAIISDAGTPLISDPGQFIVSNLKNDYNIIPIPGANSILSALVSSGLIFNSFTFLGFVPKEDEKFIKLIKNHLNSDVLIFFESPKRIKNVLEKLLNKFGDIEITIAREITKLYEENQTLLISQWLEKNIKGEIIIIIQTKNVCEILIWEEINYKSKILLEKNIDKKTISKILENNFISKNKIYKNLLENKD